MRVLTSEHKCLRLVVVELRSPADRQVSEEGVNPPLLAPPNHATLKMFGAAREPYSTASLARCFFRPFQTSLWSCRTYWLKEYTGPA